MPIHVQYNGRVHEFPDDFSQEDIAAALKTADANDQPTDIFHKGIGDTVIGMVKGAAGRVVDTARSMIAVPNDPKDHEGLFGTVPLSQDFKHIADAVKGGAKYLVTEPQRIGKQLGEGTPEAVGQSLVDTATYIPAVLGMKRTVGEPVAVAAPKVVGATARAIPPEAARLASTLYGAYTGGPMGAAEGAVAGGAFERLLDKARTFGLEQPTKPPVVNKNAGGALVTPENMARDAAQGTRTSPDINIEALRSLQELLAQERTPSTPSTPGYSTPTNTRTVVRPGAATTEEAPNVSANVGGRLVKNPVRTPSSSLESELSSALTEAPEGVEGPLSHPTGGGYTVPPPADAVVEARTPGNVGGRLVKNPAPRGTGGDSVLEAIRQALEEARNGDAAVGRTLPESTGNPSITLSPDAQQAAAGKTPRVPKPYTPRAKTSPATAAVPVPPSSSTPTLVSGATPSYEVKEDATGDLYDEARKRSAMFGGIAVNDPLSKPNARPVRSTDGMTMAAEYDPDILQRLRELLDATLKRR